MQSYNIITWNIFLLVWIFCRRLRDTARALSPIQVSIFFIRWSKIEAFKKSKLEKSKSVKILISFSENMERTTAYFVKILWKNNCQGYIVLGIDISCLLLMALRKVGIFAIIESWFVMVCNLLCDVSQNTITVIWNPR